MKQLGVERNQLIYLGTTRRKVLALLPIPWARKWIVGSVRGSSKLDGDHVAMEYDHMRDLGLADVTDRDNLRLFVRKATSLERGRFLWNHPNPIVRSNRRSLYYTGARGAVIGSLFTLITTWAYPHLKPLLDVVSTAEKF